MIASRLSLRTTAAVALQQIALGAVIFLLLAAWLHIPDANAFEVLASIVLALLIAGVAGAGESVIALRSTNKPVTARRLLLGTGAVLVAALLWYAISLGVDHLSAKDGLRAGYLNSRFPASLRNVFSYEHLVLWFEWMWRALRWIVAGLLAAGAFACITCDAPWRGLLAIFRTRRYWLSLLLLLVVEALTGMLLTWTPGHGLRVEMLSLVIRMLIVILLNAAAAAWLLQGMASAVRDNQSVGTGEPASSQPRTAGMP